MLSAAELAAAIEMASASLVALVQQQAEATEREAKEATVGTSLDWASVLLTSGLQSRDRANALKQREPKALPPVSREKSGRRARRARSPTATTA